MPKRHLLLAATFATAGLLLTSCSTTPEAPVAEAGVIALTQSPDDTLYAWDAGENVPTLEGDTGTWTLAESGYKNEELGCLLTPTILQSPPETSGSDETETEDLLSGVSTEVDSWVGGEPLLIPVDGTDSRIEVATATYHQSAEDKFVFLGARYFAQSGQIVMAIVSCDSPEGYEFATTPGGLSEAGLNLAVGTLAQ